MAQQRDLTAEALQRGAAPGRGYALARSLSQIFHPVPLSVIGFFIVGLFAIPERLTGLRWSIFCTILQIGPPTVFFSIRLRQGAYSDEDVSIRQQRNELYIFGLLTMLIGLIIFIALDAPIPFRALLCGAIGLNVSAWLINVFWKISIHALSISSLAMLATIYTLPLGALLWSCAIALGWARIRTRNHTLMQVLAGTLLSVVWVLLVFWVFGLI